VSFFALAGTFLTSLSCSHAKSARGKKKGEPLFVYESPEKKRKELEKRTLNLEALKLIIMISSNFLSFFIIIKKSFRRLSRKVFISTNSTL